MQQKFLSGYLYIGKRELPPWGGHATGSSGMVEHPCSLGKSLCCLLRVLSPKLRFSDAASYGSENARTEVLLSRTGYMHAQTLVVCKAYLSLSVGTQRDRSL